MRLSKYIFLSLILICTGSLFAQPSWRTDPADLDLTCEIGVDHSDAINDWLLINGGGTISPGCGNPVIANDYVGLSPDCAGADSVLVTFTVTDACNDMASATAWIAINDLLPPTFDQTVQDVTVNCNSNPPDLPAITITDLCDPNPSIEIALINTQTNDGSCTDINYSLERLWIAMDACGNRDTLRQKISFEDTEAPTFQGPADITLSCEANTDPANTGEPFDLQDNCSTNNSFQMEELLFLQGCLNNYTITRLWRAVDICGNLSAPFEQTIVVRDLEAPIFTNSAQDEIFDCSNPVAAESAFQDWVTANGNAVASDNCSPQNKLVWFAAVPGSYDLNNINTWPGTAPGTLSPGSCVNSVNGVIRSEQVDFVVRDECNRINSTSATFSVVDQSPPVFSYCPADLTLEILDNTCQIDWTMLLPDIDETCDNLMDNFGGSTTEAISSDSPGPLTIVNPVQLTVSGIPTPPATANENIEITIQLNNIDGEASHEFFNIFLDDGTLIGPTNLSAEQCGTSNTTFSLSPTQFQLLTLDGDFTVDLIPNVPNIQFAGVGVNDICGNSTASMSFNFEYNFPANFEVTYSLDGAMALPLDFNNPPSLTLDLGIHSVLFSATDCAGNTSTCQYEITAQDALAPMITCPANMEYSLLAEDDCSTGPVITLPLLPFTGEDCNYATYMQQQPVNANDALITFEYDPDYLEYVAQEKIVSFSNVQADAVGPAIKFTIEVRGDNQNADDYFLIYGDDDSIIGATQVNLPYVTFTPGNCPTTAPKAVAVLFIDRAIYNSWASDGIVNITATPNRNMNIPPPGIGEDGINPICTTFTEGTANGANDGVSSIYITLETERAELVYEVSGATTVAPTPVTYPAGVPSENFNIGESTVTYSISDLAGNTTSCSFNVTVTDDINPVALCQATTIFINPSSLVDYFLMPSEIDAGSTDNCGVVNLEVFPNTFSCEDIGKDTLVTLTVTDAAGNQDSCSVLVALEGEAATPDYSISLCGNDTLFLFANPPAAIGGIIYTYSWSGPNGFSSIDENPIILNASVANAGSYTLEVEGITGCTSVANLEVTLNPDFSQPTISQPATICAGDDLTLFVNIADGTSYTWIKPNFSTIETTTPFLVVENVDASAAGNWSVTVLRNGCTSPQANPVMVSVESLPNILAANNGPVCLGTAVELSANTIPGASYQWAGPNNFSAVSQNTTTTAQTGNYIVTAVSPNGCSATATTTVATLELPQVDNLTFIGEECLDGNTDVQIVSAASGGLMPYTYNWNGPVPTGSGATLTYVDATSAVNGEYQLIVEDGNGCLSSPATIEIAVSDFPSSITAFNNGPICEGLNVQLSSGNIPGANYQWTGPNNFSSILQNPSTMAIAGTYVVVASSPNGCSVTNTTTVVTLELPQVDNLAFVGEECLDGNTDVQIVSTVSGGVLPYIYNWNGPVPTGSGATLTYVDATSDLNGEYQLIVEDGNGCVSAAATIEIAVSDFPSSITALNNGPICEGLNVQLSADDIPGATYQWTGPNNFSSSLQNPTTLAVAGTYEVVAASPNGCSVMNSTEVTVLGLPQIDEINVIGETCLDGTSDIQITTASSGGSLPYIYNWTGPQPTGTGPTITFVNATANINGEYQLILQDENNCFSEPATVNVAVTNIPATPTISGAMTICEGENVLLTTDTYPGAVQYNWQTSAGNFISVVPNLLLEDVMSTTIVLVTVTVDGCISMESPAVQIPVIDMIPQPEITGPTEICSGASIQLETENISGATYNWTGPAGFSASVFNPVVFQAGVQNEGMYQVQIEQNGCTSPLSETFFVAVNENPPTPTINSIGDVCLDSEGALIGLEVSQASSIPGATYTWFNAQTNNQIGTAVSTLEFSFAPDASFSEGTAAFYVIAENSGCGSVQSIPAIVNLFEIPDGEAFAGEDFLLCDATSVTLEADDPTIGSGVWMQSGGPADAVLADPLNPNSILTNLQSGQTYAYDWILSNGACAAYDQATVNITFEAIPQANNDNVVVPFAGEATFNVKENDQIDIQFFIEIVEGPTEGFVQEIEEGEFIYQAGGNFAGEDFMIYKVCNQKCPETCTEARVDFTVGENASCDVPSIFTPNNDNVNDNFIIPCLAGDDFPENKVLIVNQYGDEVFGASPYLNNWRGTYNGEELPVGTYYYVIEYGNGQAPTSGFIILER